MAEQETSGAVTAPRYVTCPCQYCSGKIEFDANQLDAAENTTVPCPHCGLETIIFVPEHRVPPVISDESLRLRQLSGVERVGNKLSAPPPNFGRIGEDEEIVQDCIEVIRSEQKASISLLHRRLCLDYGRAARIMDELEHLGIVGPYNGAEPRDILVDLNSGGYFRGDARWQTHLGVVYSQQNNYSDAVKCFAEAAEKGHPDAQNNLGICYANGHGVIEDHSEAVKWWLKAAEQGHALAAFCLGSAHQHGRGVTENQSEAIKWYRKAAEQNLALAQDRLSDYYEKAQDYVEAYKWAKLAAGQGYEGAQKKCEDLVLKMNSAQMEALEPSDRIIWKNERLTPRQFSDFIGQERIKARLELATAAAKKRQEAIDHILLVGPPGSGKATLAHILARAMGANLKSTTSSTIEAAGDLAGLLSNLEEGDVLFIDEIHRLRKYMAEYLYPAMKDFKLDIIVDQGPNARSVRLNLPRFTLIGTTPRKEPLTTALLSCFPIIEKMDAYSIKELAALACRFANFRKAPLGAACL
jgi:TPR repeat protein